MPKPTPTARGEVSFQKEGRQPLGTKPGNRIELDLLPDAQGMLRAAQPAGTISSFIGLLARKTVQT